MFYVGEKAKIEWEPPRAEPPGNEKGEFPEQVLVAASL